MSKKDIKDPSHQLKINAFISDHAPLIHSQIKKLRSMGMVGEDHADEDLFHIGTHALFKAIQKFDPQQGSFRTYAAPTILRTIQSYLDEHRQATGQGVDPHLRAKAKAAKTTPET